MRNGTFMKSVSQDVKLFEFLSVLKGRDKPLYFFYTIIQILLSILDLIGLGLLTTLGALSVSNLQSAPPNTRILKILELLGLDSSELLMQLFFISGVATGVLLVRTTLSIIFMKKLLLFLSRKCTKDSAIYIGRFLDNPKFVGDQKSTQTTLFALTDGMEALYVYILGGIASIIADFSLLAVLIIGLTLIDPILALSTLTFFSIVGILLYYAMHRSAEIHGHKSATLRIERNDKIVEAVGLSKEIFVHGRHNFYENFFRNLGGELAESIASIRFLPYIGKYVIESAIVIGAVFVGGIQIVSNDAEQAAGSLTAFLIAGARIAPAILRLQQSATSIIGNKASAIRSLSLMNVLNSSTEPGFELRNYQPKLDISAEIPIKLSEVSFRYDSAEKFAIQNLSIQIKHGDQIAITGASGSGKTTLLDLIIGIHEPTSGEVLIGGMKPRILIQNNPGIISYMTQNSFLINGTIRDNICANLNEWVSDQDILEVIEKVDLHEFLKNKSGALDFQVGEGGKFLSGGQKQRLCLARAIISKPKILVLDEGTSAVDGLSEDTIMQSISLLKRNTTVIIVAHRMSSIIGADQILFLKDGTLIGSGDFQKLRDEVPDFNEQVEAMKF